MRLDAERGRRELEAIAAEMWKIEDLRRLRAEQRRKEEEERKRLAEQVFVTGKCVDAMIP